MKIMKVIKLLFLICMVGCSPQKRLDRLVEKHPYLFKSRIDTVVDTVVIITPTVKTDTIFSSVPGDTVTITKDKLTVKYVKLAGDSVYIEGECKSDTVVKVVKLPCEQLVVESNPYKRLFGKTIMILIAITSGIALFLIILRYVLR